MAQTLSVRAAYFQVRELAAESLADTCQVVPAVAECVILDDKLRGDRCAEAQREGCGPVQLFIGELTHCRCGVEIVVAQEFERGGFADPPVVAGMLAVQLRDHFPCDVCDRFATAD